MKDNISHSCYFEQEPFSINISYFTGWNGNGKIKQNEIEKEITFYPIKETNKKDGIIIYTIYSHFFSYGNGPTLPLNYFILYKDQTLGYAIKKKNHLEEDIWIHHVPKWQEK